ncbi:MAG: orotate phosphoribosyltransferase [Planctomycetota bacterium]|jgi:orotate phosphoribosyltransferase
MNYRSVADLNADIKKWVGRLPKDLDLIVGIPRSGLLAANLIALHLNLPFTDVDSLCKGRVLSSGPRIANEKIDLTKKNNILVVDDSLFLGTQMTRVKQRIHRASLPHQIYYVAVYVSPEGCSHVDYWCNLVNMPRVFEWNVMHHSVLSNSCVDIDGVICRDPTSKENDDGLNYQQFLTNVDPLVIPSRPIGWLVTCRLEKYRHLTEKWLSRHGIRYNHLVMMNFPNRKMRIASGSHASFKAQFYKSIDADLFIESSKEQARQIAKLSNKPILCVETREMINPSYFAHHYRRSQKLYSDFIKNPLIAPIKLLRLFKRKLKKLNKRLVEIYEGIINNECG